MRCNGRTVTLGILLLAVGLSPASFGQDPATDEDEATKKKWPFALYVEVSGGVASADTINSSISTLSTLRSENFLDLDDQLYARMAIGWKLPKGRGDMRFVFTGYKEDGYEFDATGLDARVINSENSSSTGLSPELLPYWNVTIQDGNLEASKRNPVWEDGLNSQICQFDGNPCAMDSQCRPLNPGEGNCPATGGTCPQSCVLTSDGTVGLDEIVYRSDDPRNLDLSRGVVGDLENRVQTYDIVYGRVFGRRRYSARWWAGFRYFLYEGQVAAAAWLNTSTVGQGYTEGSDLRLLSLGQQSTAIGPTGTLEARFNFFNDRLSLFVNGQAAFVVYDLEVDSGFFHTQVDPGQGATVVPVRARVTDSRTKSSWQNSAEAGVRVSLKNGVGFELAYNFTGFLDALLLPTELVIPASTTATRECGPDGCSSAIFTTKDYRLSVWRAGVSFQF